MKSAAIIAAIRLVDRPVTPRYLSPNHIGG
jgi:hypothetical protein